MINLTLLAKVKSHRQLRQVDENLKLALRGLEVESRVLGKVADRWPQLALKGVDEEVAANYILNEVGVCPATIENIGKSSTLKGFITNLENSTNELTVDIGVFEPKIVNVTVPLRRLQVQLVGGRKVGLEIIANIFGFCEDLPINSKIVRLNKEESYLEAQLAEKQISNYYDWQESLLDRLIILGPTRLRIQKLLQRQNLYRDVIELNSFGIFVHVLTCKFGTDAAGLISKIGRRLENARFAVFSPKKNNLLINES